MSVSVVYDTMVYLQAAARPERVPATFAAALDGRVTLWISKAVVAEVLDVLTRPEHVARFPALAPHAVDRFMSEVLACAKMFDPVPTTFTLPRHPDDDHIFNLGISVKAKYVVTWESRLLRLTASGTTASDLLKSLAPDLRVVTPQELATMLSNRRT